MTIKLTVGAENSLKNDLLIDINDYYIPGPNGNKYREMTADDIDATEENHFEENKNSCLDNIRNGSKSLKKIIDGFSLIMPKLNEFENDELKERASFVSELIGAKEHYYASKGLLGKILAIFSRAFGSIKDATYLKSKIDSHIENHEIVDKLSSELQSLHNLIVKKQNSNKAQVADTKKLVDKFEITLIHLNMFSKNEKHAKIITHFVDLRQKLF